MEYHVYLVVLEPYYEYLTMILVVLRITYYRPVVRYRYSCIYMYVYSGTSIAPEISEICYLYGIMVCMVQALTITLYSTTRTLYGVRCKKDDCICMD